jgi:hypothetical protein
VTDLTALRIAVLDPLATLKVDLPEEVDRLLTLWTATSDMAALDPAGELRAAAADGTLTPDNIVERLQQAALDVNAQEGALHLRRQLEPHLASSVSIALAADADRIVTGLQPAFAEAADALAALAGRFTKRDTADAVLKAGPDTTAAWHDLAAHAATLEQIAHVRLGLATTIGAGTPDVPVAMYLAQGDDLGHLRRAGQTYRDTAEPGGRWGALVRDGYTLRLNTTGEAQQLIDEATAATRAEHDARHATPPRPPMLVVRR